MQTSSSLVVRHLLGAEEHVYQDAAVPEIARLILLPHENLRRNVVKVTRLRREDLAVHEGKGEARVDDLQTNLSHRIFGLEEKAFWLEVTVAHSVFVHVGNGTDHK